jgi:hypothetical protein
MRAEQEKSSGNTLMYILGALPARCLYHMLLIDTRGCTAAVLFPLLVQSGPPGIGLSPPSQAPFPGPPLIRGSKVHDFGLFHNFSA